MHTHQSVQVLSHPTSFGLSYRPALGSGSGQAGVLRSREAAYRSRTILRAKSQLTIAATSAAGVMTLSEYAGKALKTAPVTTMKQNQIPSPIKNVGRRRRTCGAVEAIV